MGFDTQDLIRATGYTEGDYLPLISIRGAGNNTFGTTTTSFVSNSNLLEVNVKWDDIIPESSTAAVAAAARGGGNIGDTVTYRVRNTTDGETVLELPVDVNTKVSSGWVEYTPTTTNAPITLRGQLKTSDGASKEDLVNPYTLIGVELE